MLPWNRAGIVTESLATNALFTTEVYQQQQACLWSYGKNRKYASPLRPKPHAQNGKSSKDIEAVYEEMYSNGGYHDDLRISHAGELVKLIALRYHACIHAVLDVGCSHGRGVQMLWEKGIRASGMDVSPTAVEMARKARKPPGGEKLDCVDSCFQASSATAIPWPDEAFDAILSTDVMEHITEEDVPAVLKEFSRVVRSYLFLKIADVEEKYKQSLQKAHSKHHFANISKLHVTIKKHDWWIARFKEANFDHVFSVHVKKLGVASYFYVTLIKNITDPDDSV